MQIDLQKINKVYFIGIGGIMMSAAARYFLGQDKVVCGSDREKNPITSDLERLGAKIFIGQRASNIDKGFDLIIYTQAIDSSNPELARAKKLAIKTLTIFELLGILSKEKFTVTVSGMHGKSTTASMVALIMEKAKLDPTVFVGTKLKEWQGNFRLGRSDYFLSEACEYKDNFLNYHPDMAVITNIEPEHLDYFKNLAGVMKSFGRFASQTKEGGSLIVNSDDRNCRELASGVEGKVITFGIRNKADFQAAGIKTGKGITRFQVLSKNRKYNGRVFQLRIPGEFNVYNALAAIAVAAKIGIEPEIVSKVLNNFIGVWRRFEFRGKAREIEFYDDYGHHPTEIRATLSAAIDRFKNKNLWVVFQPHLYSRTHDFLEGFAEALNLSPNLILADIYAAREKNIYKITSRDLVDLINKKYRRENPALYLGEFQKIITHLKKNLKRNDILLTMGAGEAYKIGDEILSYLKKI
ncbi:UDP-N-acetylmuramate--L-alanine ligase [Candidatus Kuenenbacteria bacterium]|nr:UDP-N-acetylmuramate--L-alanine ligase [Candidatus Kuenenbacteria bacterium]